MSKPARPRLKRYTSLAVAADLLSQRSLALVSPSLWEDHNDKFLLEQYKERSGSPFVGAVCLTTAPETFHHWKTFADGLNGVCLEFDKEMLERHVLPLEGVRAGNVSYVRMDQIDAAPCKAVEELPFLKRAGFSAEKEYRIVYGGIAGDGVYRVPIDIGCINRIVLSPFVPDGLALSIKGMLKNIEGCGNLRITQSRLTNSSSWKRSWTKRLVAQFGELP